MSRLARKLGRIEHHVVRRRLYDAVRIQQRNETFDERARARATFPNQLVMSSPTDKSFCKVCDKEYVRKAWFNKHQSEVHNVVLDNNDDSDSDVRCQRRK
jgi:hypothetical protein